MTTDPKTIAPPCALLVMCVECGDGIEVALPTDRDAVALRLARSGWFMTGLTPPGRGPEVSVVMGALCGSCAALAYPPEVLKLAEERRQKLLAEKR